MMMIRVHFAMVLRALLLVTGLLCWPAAFAQTQADAAEIRGLELEIDALKRDMGRLKEPDARAPLAERARSTREHAAALQAELAVPLAQIEQRIAQLGPDAQKSADAAVRRQAGALAEERADNVALARRAALAEVEATQALEALTQARAKALGQEFLERTASPLTPSLWTLGVASLRKDLARAAAAAPGKAGKDRAMPLIVVAALAWLALAALALWPGRRALNQLGMRLVRRLAAREPRLALAVFAVWSVVAGVLVPTAFALALLMLVSWIGVPGLAMDLGATTIAAMLIGVYVSATTTAILQPAHRSWRLWRIGDEAAALGASAGKALAWAFAVVAVVEAAVNRLAVAPASRTLLHSALAFVSVAQIGYALYKLGRMRRAIEAPQHDVAQPARGGLVLAIGIGWIGVVVLSLFGVLGYVNFANRLSQWAIWAAVVGLTLYILMCLTDGLCGLLATARSGGRQRESTRRALQQAAVLLSAVCRTLLLFLGCGALLVPFGAGFTSVLGLLAPLLEGFEVGGIRISVWAVLRALLAFAIVITLVKFIRSWVTDSYLPTTGLQQDARDSIDKILRYLAIVLGVLWALTAFGVGMEKVAILASALSVGIGFGLQAITQNFVSGLILLIERPVKIGDWVKLNEVEGDIRRINVRSTEIQVGDHSTMIVPNSELITKVVQNKTKGNSLGRAQILLSVPLAPDLERAMEAVQETLGLDEDVLAAPAPAVFIDRIEGGLAVLNCFVHVRSPRMAYGVRSRLILSVLRHLHERDIPVTLPPQQFVLAPATPA
jgi:potassium-dependent mechanosensitive channel